MNATLSNLQQLYTRRLYRVDLRQISSIPCQIILAVHGIEQRSTPRIQTISYILLYNAIADHAIPDCKRCTLYQDAWMAAYNGNR